MKYFYFLLLLIYIACDKQEKKAIVSAPVELEPVSIDFPEIETRDTLYALTRFGSNSYFMYRGQIMGYEYELLDLFCKSVNIHLKMRVPRSWTNLDSLLYSGYGDIIAANYTVTKERDEVVDFTDPLLITFQVLVQRKPDNWRDLKSHQIDKQLIRNPLGLIDKKVSVRKNTSYENRLINLSDEIGGPIIIDTVNATIETEELIRMVAEGEVDYTIADQNIAYSQESRYPNIDTRTQVSLDQRIAWAIRPNADSLRIELNRWIRKMKVSNDPTFNLIRKKYYGKTVTKLRSQSEFFTTSTGKISQYDDMIKNFAKDTPFDWRLISSQIYQESQFDRKKESWMGAIGLMQLMPITIKDLRVKNAFNAQENIQAGTRYMVWLYKQFHHIPDDIERLKFTLASYNAGIGHVRDAQRLAEKDGVVTNIWTDHVDQYILKKSQRKYYEDPVVKFGYCRGSEPYNYVNEVLKRYQTYQQFVK